MSLHTPSPPPSDNQFDPLVDRKLAAIGKWLWPLLILMLFTFLPWLGLRLGACTSDLAPWICDWAFIIPLTPGLLMAWLLCYGLLILIRHGRDSEYSPMIESKSWVNPAKGSHFVRAGYRKLGDARQKHVRLSLLPFALGLAELVGFWTFYFGLPAIASMLSGAATVGLALVFLRWVRGRPPIDTGVALDAPLRSAATPRKIILFSDGTGNSSAKAQKTNVWRLFEAIDQRKADQIAMYDDGVGSSSNRLLAILGGAFGFGLKRNVIDLYKFVCRNYAPGDDIYCFGFSRGAFTIRVLVGLIAREGLVAFRSESELDHTAAAAYRSYRSKAFPPKNPVIWLIRKLRDLALGMAERVYRPRAYERRLVQDDETRPTIPIRFLGLWDTVEAYGMPIAGLKRGIDWVIWPMVFGDMKLAKCVKRAVHALSLDDERTTFHPLLWDEAWEAELAERSSSNDARVTQVWFAGVHSNVGGGYPEDQLSLVPLEWVAREAVKNGLRVDATVLTQIKTQQSPYARLYDSRAGFAAYYRYSPRTAPRSFYKDQQILINVHWSVLVRMVNGGDSYAPITLPHDFNVWTPSGELLHIDRLREESTPSGLMDPDAKDLRDAVRILGKPDHNEIALVWDTVFWRRCVYVLTMALSLLAVAFPWSNYLVPDRLRTWEEVASGPVSTLVNALDGLIPTYLSPWKSALKRDPIVFGLLLIGIAITLVGSESLEERIHNRARLAWHLRSIEVHRQWRIDSRNGIVSIVCWGMILLGMGAMTALIFGSLGVAGSLGMTALVLGIGYCISVVGYLRRSATSASRIRDTMALAIARRIRRSVMLQRLYCLIADVFIPVMFALLLVVVAWLIVNRAISETIYSSGVYCVETPSNSLLHVDNQMASDTDRAVPANARFATNRMCWASGLWLEEGHRYRITLTMGSGAANRWFDGHIPTDVHGYPGTDFKHRLAKPLTRSWSENWFMPIARIGRFGNDEYPLKSIEAVDPLPPAPACAIGLDLESHSKATKDFATQVNDCMPPASDRQRLTAEITARSTGELFVYVNDAVLSVPGVSDYFFDNNSGSAEVRVEPVTRQEFDIEPSGRGR